MTLVPACCATSPGGPCPEVEVVFARGRTEPPGTGQIGQAFVNSLRSKTDKTSASTP